MYDVTQIHYVNFTHKNIVCNTNQVYMNVSLVPWPSPDLARRKGGEGLGDKVTRETSQARHKY